MVVLSLGLEPSASLQEQAQRLGVVLNRWGFAATRRVPPAGHLPARRVRRGRVPGAQGHSRHRDAGQCRRGPGDVPLAKARGSRVRDQGLSARARHVRRTAADRRLRLPLRQQHRLGGRRGAGRRSGRGCLPGVVLAETNVYTCADDNQDRMKAKIAEHRLNRVVVASCTPRTHEPIFRDTLRDAGLNPYLLEMANIRDQCSWVHSGNPAAATEKAIDLVRMATARAAALVPLQEATAPVNHAALVVGGGIAGMTAALALAEQGFPVHLVEKGDRLGGTSPPDPPHAGRPRRPGPAGRDHRAHEDPSADHRPLAVARGEGRRARGRVHFPNRQWPVIRGAPALPPGEGQGVRVVCRQGNQQRRNPSWRGRRGHRRHGAEARHVPAMARTSG